MNKFLKISVLAIAAISASVAGSAYAQEVKPEYKWFAGPSKVFTFDEPITCGNHSGVIKFGNVNNIVSIDTTGGDEDDQY